MATKLDLRKALAHLLKDTSSHTVKAGILEGATNSETGQNIAQYAAFNEYGTSTIPARPFMRTTIAKHSDEWLGELAQALKVYPPDKALQFLGIRMRDVIVEQIASNMPPPNAPSTLRQKQKEVVGKGKGAGGSMVPGTLIDTGSMINAVNYEVSK